MTIARGTVIQAGRMCHAGMNIGASIARAGASTRPRGMKSSPRRSRASIVQGVLRFSFAFWRGPYRREATIVSVSVLRSALTALTIALSGAAMLTPAAAVDMAALREGIAAAERG